MSVQDSNALGPEALTSRTGNTKSGQVSELSRGYNTAPARRSSVGRDTLARQAATSHFRVSQESPGGKGIKTPKGDPTYYARSHI